MIQIVTQASPYKGTLLRCKLCLTEKLCILSTDRSMFLKKRPGLKKNAGMRTSSLLPIRNRIAPHALHELVKNLVSTVTTSTV